MPGQIAKWKDAQQQWKEAAGRLTNEFKERQTQLASERDAAISQNEAITKELEIAKADLRRVSKQNQDLTASAAGRTATDTDSVSA